MQFSSGFGNLGLFKGANNPSDMTPDGPDKGVPEVSAYEEQSFEERNPIDRDHEMELVNREEELRSLLKDMDIPGNVKAEPGNSRNLRWLLRNMQIRNSGHPNYERARELVIEAIQFL